MDKIKKHSKIIIAAGIILVLAGAFVWGRFGFSNSQSQLPFAFVKAQKTDFVRAVKLDGTVKPAEEIKLSFELAGKIAKVNVKAGDKVKAGQILAELAPADLSANYLSAVAGWQMAKSQVAQTQAVLDMQNLQKQNILKGAKTEDVNVSEMQAANAEKALADAKTNLANVQSKADTDMSGLYAKVDNSLNDSFNKAHDALYLQTNLMFTDADTYSPKLTFATPLEGQSGQAAVTERIKAGQAFAALSADVKKLAPDYSDSGEVLAKIKIDLAVIRDFLNSLNEALKYTSVSNSFPQATLIVYQGNVSGAIASVNATISSLDSLSQSLILQTKVNQNAIFSAQSQVDQAQSALDLANGQLALKKSSATKEQLAIQDAQIRQAQAGLAAQNAQLTAAVANSQKAKSQLDKATLVAPINGVITNVDLELGEAVSPNVPVIGLQSAGKFQVETFLPELYVGEVKAGNQANVSFDVYGNDNIFAAKVISIDPAAVNSASAPVYRTLLEFTKDDAAIKTGLTANIKIIIMEEENILTIPEASVIKDGEKSFVIVDDGTRQGEKREVVVGEAGSGLVPVLSGLKEGDLVANFSSPALGQ